MFNCSNSNRVWFFCNIYAELNALITQPCMSQSSGSSVGWWHHVPVVADNNVNCGRAAAVGTDKKWECEFSIMLPSGCVHTKSDAAMKTQHFQFIFNRTPCGSAATVIDTVQCADDFRLKWSSAQLFYCRVTTSNHVSRRSDTNTTQQTTWLSAAQCVLLC